MKGANKGAVRVSAEPIQPQAKMKHVRSVNQNPRCDLPEAKRLLIVDDHPLFRKGLEELIHSDANFAVCGEADNAAEAMEVIRKLNPDMAIVDLSLPGANGIELIKAIREVFNGRPYLSPAMAAQVITKFAHRQTEGETDAVERLSDRELEILELIGKGNEVRQIAKLLHLSPKTVETHRAHIKDKLDLKNSREVARFALQWLQAREG